MFAIGFVVALVAVMVDLSLTYRLYYAENHWKRRVASGFFWLGIVLMAASVSVVAWKYLP